MAALSRRSPRSRAVMARLGRELSRAAGEGSGAIADPEHFYGGAYFGEGRDPSGDRQGLSGYATYDRVSSNADVAGWVMWRNFGGAVRTLDVGTATGFVVEVLRELGVEAEGCDVSEYAVEHAAPGARGHLRVADLRTGLPWADRTFDLVSALETLEHMPPSSIPAVVAELTRVCRGFLYLTIPSFGPNDEAGPAGHYEGKVLSERVVHYQELGPDYDGPVPYEDLARDARGEPVEGHLTIASYRWWTERFAEAGCTRRPDVERRIYADIEPGTLVPYWNVYVFAVPGADEAVAAPRDPERTLVELGLRHPRFAVA